MRAVDLLESKLTSANVIQDFDQLVREYGVTELRVLNPQEEVGSWRQPIRLLIRMQPGKSYGELLQFEGELETLIGQHLELVSEGGLKAERLNQLIQESVGMPLNAGG